MKQALTTTVLVLIGLFILSKYGGPIPVSLTSTVTNKTDMYTVMGEGKVSIAPDIARTTVGVEAQAATVKQAQSQLNSAMNRMIESLKKLSISAKDIKTSSYYINPQYDYSNGKQRITGYQASSMVTVTIRDLDSINEVIDAATANGATNVSGISFDVEDKTKAENEARDIAVKDAKEKAAQASRIAGFSLGRIVNYNESLGGAMPRPMMYASKMVADGAESTQVEPGTNEVTVSVTLSYELK